MQYSGFQGYIHVGEEKALNRRPRAQYGAGSQATHKHKHGKN
jgi:hypothetical protein